MRKNEQFLRAVGISVFVLLCGMMIFAFHSNGSQTFSRGIDTPLTDSPINIQEIKENMEKMDQKEIEETIEKIEREIERLKSEI